MAYDFNQQGLLGGIGNILLGSYSAGQRPTIDPNAFKMDPNDPWQQRQGLTMDQGLTERQYGNQQALIAMLQQQAAGQGPSVAQLMMQRGLQQAQAQQMGSAASAAGANRALATRGAAYNNAAMGQDIVGQSGALRAQEMLQGRQLLGDQLMGMRGQDIGVAGSNLQAGMQQRQLNDAQTQAALQAQIQAQQTQAQMDAEYKRRQDASRDFLSRVGLAVGGAVGQGAGSFLASKAGE